MKYSYPRDLLEYFYYSSKSLFSLYLIKTQIIYNKKLTNKKNKIMEKELIKNAVAIGLISSAYSLVITLLVTGIIERVDIYKDKKAKQRKEGN